MSTFNERDITCGNCGEIYKGIIWTAIHASQDPELKTLLFGGELNLLMCPQCAHVDYQEHSLLYQDPDAELIAYIYPESQKTEEEFLRKALLKNFQEAQEVYEEKDRKTYEPILVFGLEAFIEMMREEDARSAESQIAQAICKERGIPFKLLRPSEARRLNVMRVMPKLETGAKADRSSILGGLEKLLAINPLLSLYSGLQAQIKEDATWSLV